jgi:DNA-binding NtrC family response regulator
MNPTLSIAAAQSSCRKRTALVVDDVEDMLDLLEIALHAADFGVLRASSASEALDLFEARPDEIDLLMTDVRIGVESGLELAGRLLTHKPSLQVLAMSGFALDGQVVSGQGKVEFLPKPFSTSELRKKLQSIFPPDPGPITVTVSATPAGRYRVSASCPNTVRLTNADLRRLGR